MFAHENDGYAGGKASKGRCGRGGQRDMVPCTGVGKTRLEMERQS